MNTILTAAAVTIVDQAVKWFVQGLSLIHI